MIHYDYISLLRAIFLSVDNFIYREDVLEYSHDMAQLLIDHLRRKFNHFNYKNIEDVPIVDKSTIDRSLDLNLNCFNNKTSGSSGPKFNYKIWWECFNYIESSNHYRQILREFGFGDTITTLKLYHSQSSELWYLPINDIKQRTPNSSYTQLSDNVYINKSIARQEDFALSHGAKQATNFLIICDIKNIRDAIRHIINLTKTVEIDIFTCASSCFNMIIEEDIKHKLCSLYSQTGETFNINDATKAINSGIIDDYCDHMRSWDGGATFLTCKNHTYHLLDNLTYNECIDNHLISTDFLNIGQPFLRYKNGDQCEIDTTINRCECGRYYRKFVIKGRQPFTWKNISSVDVLDFISNFDQFIQVICYDDHVKVICNESISSKNKEIITDFFGDVIFDSTYHAVNYKMNRIVDLRQNR